MDKKVICRVCGYIIDESLLGDECPACGVKRSVFQDYLDPVHLKRRRLLNFHFHSMVVHFPQSFATVMLFFIILIFLVQDPMRGDLLITLKPLSFLLPFSVIASLVTGVFDGRIRFKKLKTVILKTKMAVAAIFFLSSTALALIIHMDQRPQLWLMLIFCSIAFLSAIFLGKKGGSLVGLEVPG